MAQILLSLMPDDFTRQWETPLVVKGLRNDQFKLHAFIARNDQFKLHAFMSLLYIIQAIINTVSLFHIQ